MENKKDEELKAQLTESVKKRVSDCIVEIKEVLEKHNCKIEPIIIISNRGIGRDFEVIPL